MKPKYSETDIAIERHDGLLKKNPSKTFQVKKLKLTFQIKGPLGQKKTQRKHLKNCLKHPMIYFLNEIFYLDDNCCSSLPSEA